MRARNRFIAGQTTEKGECSVGCHDNFYVFKGSKEDATSVDMKAAADNEDLEAAKDAPCGTDTVVIPEGYNVNLLAMVRSLFIHYNLFIMLRRLSFGPFSMATVPHASHALRLVYL